MELSKFKCNTVYFVMILACLFLTACGGGGNGSGGNGNNNNNNSVVTIAISPMTADVKVGQSVIFTVTTQNTDFKISGSPQGDCVRTGNKNVTCTPVVQGGYNLIVEATADASKTATATVTIRSDIDKPTVPANLTTTAASTSQINLSWMAATDDVGVVGYRIYRDGATFPVQSVTTLSFSDAGLNSSMRYCYQVSAYDAAGNESSLGELVCATTTAISDMGKPTVPANLTATVASTSQIDLSWAAATDDVGVVGYRIYRDGATSPVQDVAALSFSDRGLGSSTRHCYQVLAYDAAGNESGLSELVCATTTAWILDTVKPTVPANLTATAVSVSQIDLSWAAATDDVGVVGYRIYSVSSPVRSVATLSFSDTGLRSSTRYCYQVSAYDAAGNESSAGELVCATTATISVLPIPELTVVARDFWEIDLLWSVPAANGEVVGYRIYRDGSELPYIQQNDKSARRFPELNLKPATKHCYQISTYSQKGDESEKSASVCATTLAETAPSGNVSIDMVFVKGGTFTKGCTAEQGDCTPLGTVHYEVPHLATVSDFYIGRYEITNADWNAVMGEANNPSPIRYWWSAGGTYLDGYCGDSCTRDVDNFPMLNVSFDDIQEFIRKLNELTGKKYRLPTEAEWEYAARGGDKSMGYKYSGKNIADDVAWHRGNSDGGRYNPVGGKLPNELGIYDMSGNASEWVDGFYQGDPIIRGGHVGNNAEQVKISHRSSWYRDRPSGGFRLAISAE